MGIRVNGVTGFTGVTGVAKVTKVIKVTCHQCFGKCSFSEQFPLYNVLETHPFL